MPSKCRASSRTIRSCTTAPSNGALAAADGCEAAYAIPRNRVILTCVMPARVKAAAAKTNPFRFGRIVFGDAFTDREADLLALER